MLWKSSHLSASKLSGLALGVCILPVIGTGAFAQDATQMQYTGPSKTEIKGVGIRTAVVAATDTGGDADVALRALKAATIALGRTQGYSVIPANEVAKSLQSSNLRWPFVPRQYPEVKKKLGKADRVVSVSVSPTEALNTYTAVVEMFDTNNGGLVGRGEGTYTVSVDSLPLVNSTSLNAPAVTTTKPVLGSFEVPADTTLTASANTSTLALIGNTLGTDVRFLAVDGAILRAMAQMNEPAQIRGIIVSLPGGYLARLSKGEMHGLRNGARIEYTARGRTIAYGTAVDVGKGESLATVAAERDFPGLEVNGTFRSTNNPVKGIAGKTREEFDAKEWSKFENQFGLAVAVTALSYLVYLELTETTEKVVDVIVPAPPVTP